MVMVMVLHALAFASVINAKPTEKRAESVSAVPLSVRWVSPEPQPAKQPVRQETVQPESEKQQPEIAVKKTLPVRKMIKKPVRHKPKPQVQPQKIAKTAPEPQQTVVSQPVKQQAPQQAIPVEAPKFSAAYLSNPSPVYPRRSRMLEEEGTVKLKVHVSAEGKAISVALFKSSGFTRLDEAAIAAVEQWRFVPARQANTSIAGWVIVPVSFRLRS